MADLFFDRDEDEARPEPEVRAAPVRRRPQRRGGRRGRWLGLAGLVLVVALLAAGIGAAWVQRRLDPPGPPGERLSITIPSGATTADVAELLADRDVVTDARIFRYYLRFRDGGPFQAGTYGLRRNSSMGDALATLDDGPLLAFTDVTVPEGRWASDVDDIVGSVRGLAGAAFSAAVDSGAVRSRFQPDGVTSLEGLLFPDTYRIDENEDELAVLTRMVGTLDDVATELGYADAPARVGRTPYETLIVASLIEAEAKVDADRGKISRVIYNRLADGTPLGIDATVYYALQRRGGGLTERDLAVDSPYNTRLHAGLPPTPIGLPGRESLEAAISPEPGPWRYYVLADSSGAHAFSETYADFQRDVAAARRNGLLDP